MHINTISGYEKLEIEHICHRFCLFLQICNCESTNQKNVFGEDSQNKHVVEENDNSTDDDVAKLFVFVVKLDFHLKRNIFSKLSYLRLNITKKLFV